MCAALETETDREREALQLVGLARRAGRVAVGTRSVREAARRGKLSIVIVAEDATQNSLARLGTLVRDPGLPVVRCGDRSGLGRAVGRSEAVVVGVSDPGLAERIATVANRSGGPAPEGTGDGLTNTK
ncbi:MAG: L7Ae/L30e/S12e/Gadd45 family ribosomal protein [Candidatus Palauibacterales bacterium]|nr:L7Ae/L30e/S12e/Gadd45 family ribosomal protein [Candidatus Palauibacterales bacterium]MDP2482101.1 L7Ae/L30e/S12e/Gadd45 family ribosomal protein [Candidatus Palauibacterales bacterium]